MIFRRFEINTRYAAKAKNGVFRIALSEKNRNTSQNNKALISIRRRLKINDTKDRKIIIL